MKKSFSLLMLSVLTLISLWGKGEAQAQWNKDNKAIETTLHTFYRAQSLNQALKCLAWPYTEVVSTGHQEHSIITYQNAVEYEKKNKHKFQQVEKLKEQMPQQEAEDFTPVAYETLVPRLSHIRISKLRTNLAYISYYLGYKSSSHHRDTEPSKPCIAILQKEKHVWRLIFNTVP